jgi:hypothetical protein
VLVLEPTVGAIGPGYSCGRDRCKEESGDRLLESATAEVAAVWCSTCPRTAARAGDLRAFPAYRTCMRCPQRQHGTSPCGKAAPRARHRLPRPAGSRSRVAFARLQVLARGQMAGMMLGQADRPRLRRQPDARTQTRPSRPTVSLAAFAAKHKRSGMSGWSGSRAALHGWLAPTENAARPPG